MPAGGGELAARRGRLQPRLAALEMLLYPVSGQRMSRLARAGLGGVGVGAQRRQPGRRRATGSALDRPGHAVRLGPVPDRARARDRARRSPRSSTTGCSTRSTPRCSCALRVLTPAELAAASADDDVLADLATIAYTYTLGVRQGRRAREPRQRSAVRRRHAAALRRCLCSRPQPLRGPADLHRSRCRTERSVRARRAPPPDPAALVGYHRAPGRRPARPDRGPVPERPDRVLAAVRREQLDGGRRPRAPAR